ncbi:hypothetical protein BS50DRAFT_568639 [Corynespora cassiicola Philippines]|uniref:AA1-like domain-containing protein n=1 Tax=Corynespora cassiicola Philippines TaxID=1448308 RepID=A0A2T2P5V4_CORCC|nr:hypothetical protein BS50DRAFT_568639 [Corynespora cassiicola Philippines]
MISIKSLSLIALAQLVIARPGPLPPFQVTNLYTFEPSGRPGNANVYRVSFNVTDPSDSSSTYCETNWGITEATTGYPSNYVANCTDPSWAFKFVGYVNYYDFDLDVQHSSKKHGKKVTKYAKGVVDDTIIQCSHAASGFSVCNQRDGVAFPLPVYDVKKEK